MNIYGLSLQLNVNDIFIDCIQYRSRPCLLTHFVLSDYLVSDYLMANLRLPHGKSQITLW